MPRIVAVLVAASAVVAIGAPVLVRVVAPGLADPALAVTCTRLTSITVLTFGLAGYLSAALRANNVFGAPASIHLAYNVGILGLMWTLHGRIGIVSAAAGVALGSVFMVLAQLPSYLRHIGVPQRWRVGLPAVTLGAFAPIAIYTLSRQAQVFVERFLGSSLAPGTISHLNYAQKVAQMPMLVALLICTVTFPVLARSVASGEAEIARRRLQADLRTVTALIFVSAAFLIAFAPQVVGVLLEHGRFTPADTDGHRGDHAGVRAGPVRARHGRRAVPAVLPGRAPDLVPGDRDGRRAGRHRRPRGGRGAVLRRLRDRRRQRGRHHRHRRAAADRAARPDHRRSR